MPLRLKGTAPTPGETDRRYYMIDVQEGNRRVRLSSGTRSKPLAERKEQIVLDALREDITVPHADLQALVRGHQRSSSAALVRHSGSRILKEACDDALADPQGWGRLDTVGTYRTNCKMLQKALGPGFLIARIDQAVLNDLVSSLLKAGNATTTVNRKLFALMYVLRRERELGNLSAPLPKWKPFDEKDRARTFEMTLEDEAAILDQILALDSKPKTHTGGRPRKTNAHEYHDLFVFLADVGCRLSQALKVRWRDVVEEGGRTYIRFARKGEQKGGKTRTIPCTDRVTALLQARRSQSLSGPFSNLTRRRAGHIWDTAKAETHLADEAEAVPHSLRHTCATRLLELTGDIKLVQEWLGHTTIETTSRIYAHVLVGTKASAADLLNRKVQRAGIPESSEIRDRNLSVTETMPQVTH